MAFDRSSSSRIPSLDGLRGIAAIAVMLFHFDFYYLPQAGLGAFWPGIQRGYLGCDLFFVLSGFVMAHVYGQPLASSRRKHWANFARARFARIYPLFVLTTLVMVILHALMPLKLPLVVMSAGYLLLQPLLLQVWGSDPSWNYPAWSIGTEAIAYVLFVFFARPVTGTRRPWWLAAVLLTVLAALALRHGDRLNLFWGWPALLRTVAEFGLGSMLHIAYRRDRHLPGTWLALIAAACVGLSWALHSDLFDVMAMLCVIHYGSQASTWLARCLDSRPALALGSWSYSIYLWHAPTHYAVMAACAALRHPVATLSANEARVLVVATFAAVIALSAASFHYFEEPVRRLLRRRLMPSPATAAAAVAG